MRIVVINHLSLDGVMQAPGRADEDTRGGFGLGGWAIPGNDEVMGRFLGERMGRGGGLLLGRRTYDDLLSHWNSVPDSPFTAALNHTPKHVVSTTLSEPLPWPSSTLISGDVAAAIAELKQRPGGDLTIMGSGQLVASLAPFDLVDEYVLMIHPITLGTGRRLFPDGGVQRALRLAEAITTTTGVVIATYLPSSPTHL